MSLYKRGEIYWYRFRWNGSKPYRGSCKTSKLSEARIVESLVLAQLLENKRPPGSQKIPTLAEFSGRFFQWLDSLPTDRPPKKGTRKYYHVGWKLLEKTTMAGRRLDHIESDPISALVVGSSPPNTNNALRTLSRMLKRAQEWKLIQAAPKVRLVEEQGREIMLEPWMEAKLLAVTEIARTPTSKHAPKSSNYGWQPLRDVLLSILDAGMRPEEVFRMRKEHVKWDNDVIFVPRGKSLKSRRYVPLSERLRTALLSRMTDGNEGWMFPSPRSLSGHIETVQKQFERAKKLAGLPEDVVLYCARHRFGTDAMDGTGNIVAVMDALGHSKMDVTRLYQHPGLKEIRNAINKRNESCSEHKTEHTSKNSGFRKRALSN
jgi:integrase